MILALDLSTTATGWCIGGPLKPKPHALGTIRIDGTDRDRRIAHTVRGILDLIKAHGIEHVLIEDLFYMRGGKVVRALFMIHGALIYELFFAGIDYTYVNQSTAKTRIGLKGNCKKPEVLKRVLAMGIKATNEDEADAVAVFFSRDLINAEKK